MLTRILTRIKAGIARRVGPVMIYGFRSSSGILQKNTRYGSTNYYQGKELIDMGDYVYIAHHCFIDGTNGLRIEEGCQICSWSSLLTHSSHNAIRLYGKSYGGTKMKGYNKGSVRIGSYSFVGPHVTVMPGTDIGKGCLLSAYSYVKGTFPDFSIIAGNPAKIVGDTRKLDKPYLEENPELIPFYEEWAGKFTSN